MERKSVAIVPKLLASPVPNRQDFFRRHDKEKKKTNTPNAVATTLTNTNLESWGIEKKVCNDDNDDDDDDPSSTVVCSLQDLIRTAEFVSRQVSFLTPLVDAMSQTSVETTTKHCLSLDSINNIHTLQDNIKSIVLENRNAYSSYLDNPQDTTSHNDQNENNPTRTTKLLHFCLQQQEIREDLVLPLIALAILVEDGKSAVLLLKRTSSLSQNLDCRAAILFAMQWASVLGHVHILETLVAQCKCPVQGEAYHGQYSPLVYAVLANRIAVVQYLGKHHDVPIGNGNCACAPNGMPLLHYAAYHGLIDMVQCLLQHCGANPNQTYPEYGVTPLHVAAMSSKPQALSIIQLLVEAKANINDTIAATGETALHLATKMRQVKIVKALLENGADANVPTTDDHLLPIHLAVICGHAAIVKLLVEFCHDCINARDVHENTPLMLAMDADDNADLIQDLIEMGGESKTANENAHVLLKLLRGKLYSLVNLLLEQGVDVNASENDGETPLHALCRDTDAPVSILRLLVGAGAKVNATSLVDGSTPLLWALYSGNTAVAQELLELGADLFNRTHAGTTPYHVAQYLYPEQWNDGRFYQYWKQLVQLGDKERLESLWACVQNLRSAAKHTMLLACRHNSTVVIQAMLDEGFPIDKKLDGEGNTPLQTAVLSNSIGAVDLLFNLGANIDCRDKDGWTPLHVACQERNNILSSKLVANGANIDALTGKGESALLIAAKNGYLEQVRCLVENNANVNRLCSPQFTVLHFACYTGNLEIAQYLIDHGAETEILSYEGYTALQYASEQGHVDIVDILVRGGANLVAKLHDGRTPLYIACSRHYVEVANILLKGGADIDQKSYNEFTALHCSAFLGQADLVEILLKHGADPYEKTPCGQTAMDLATSRGHHEILEMLLAWDLSSVKRNWEDLKTLVNTSEFVLPPQEDTNDGLQQLGFGGGEGTPDTISGKLVLPLRSAQSVRLQVPVQTQSKVLENAQFTAGLEGERG